MLDIEYKIINGFAIQYLNRCIAKNKVLDLKEDEYNIRKKCFRDILKFKGIDIKNISPFFKLKEEDEERIIKEEVENNSFSSVKINLNEHISFDTNENKKIWLEAKIDMLILLFSHKILKESLNYYEIAKMINLDYETVLKCKLEAMNYREYYIYLGKSELSRQDRIRMLNLLIEVEDDLKFKRYSPIATDEDIATYKGITIEELEIIKKRLRENKA